MAETNRYTSRCPVCDSPLDLAEDAGYLCPQCGWDELTELGDDEVWDVSDDQGDEDYTD